MQRMRPAQFASEVPYFWLWMKSAQILAANKKETEYHKYLPHLCRTQHWTGSQEPNLWTLEVQNNYQTMLIICVIIIELFRTVPTFQMVDFQLHLNKDPYLSLASNTRNKILQFLTQKMIRSHDILAKPTTQ